MTEMTVSKITLIVLFLTFLVYFFQACSMSKQVKLMARNTEILRQSQGMGLLVQIFKSFYEKDFYNAIFNYLSNPKNKDDRLGKIVVQKAGASNQLYGITIKPISHEPSEEMTKLEDCLAHYFGWFEMLYHSLEANLVKKEVAKRLFGYYLEESLKPAFVREFLYMDAEFHWEDLKKLSEEFEIKFPEKNP